MTGPREWRHAEGCPKGRGGLRCTCGLSAVRDADTETAVEFWGDHIMEANDD